MHKFDEKLHNLLQKVRENEGQNQNLMVIFDLDSTLYNVTHRTQQILWDLGHSNALENLQKGLSEILHKIEVFHNDWGVKEALRRVGIDEDKIIKGVRKAWGKHFFANHYLEHDKPYPGAVEFVQDLHSFGVPISYLTGRYRGAMLEGTIKSLKDWGFPTEDNGAQLFMKDDTQVKDVEYKIQVLEKLVVKFDEIWFFENEPVITNEVANVFPHINVVFMDSVHSGRAEPLNVFPSLKMKYLKDE